MEELTDTFGALSTNAAEWTPSELNPSGVKEFVPGQGWAPTTTDPHPSQQDSHQGQQDPTPLESSVPAGPLPASTATDTDDVTWRLHRDRALSSVQQMDPSDPQHNAIPLPYCNAASLGGGGSQSATASRQQPQRRRRFGYPSAVYRVTNRHDGQLYCLQRFENVRCVNHSIAVAVTERWQQRLGPPHFALATLHSCFVAQRAVFGVHQYIPGAQSLEDYLVAESSPCLPEPMVWTLVSQLVAGIRAVHRARLAVRTLQARHILVTTTTNGGGSHLRLRVHIGSLGMLDALEFEARKHVELLQQEDLVDLGRLLLVVTQSRDGRLDASRYSPELQTLTLRLLSAAAEPPSRQQQQQRNPPVSLAEVCSVVARCCAWDELESVYRALDRSEAIVATEYNASRAFRLLLKMGFVNERPEFGPNRRWAQSGDCFVLSLFRDYVFHQADSQGQPIMDLGHVVTALNKLDAADEEKIVLTSRDGKSLMVVSYADVARCLEGAFHELCAGAVAPSAYQY